MERIPVAMPALLGNERAYVMDCLDTNWISSNGKYISAFEQAFADFCGAKRAIAVCNGTAALHLALLGLGVSAGDEVIVPTVTYVATANAVTYCGATPVFADVTENFLTIDPSDIEKKITPKTRGIIVVHLYGHPAEMQSISELARKHGLWVVEDAAEAHGSEAYGRKIGTWGKCATFSFFGNKIITSGEGGMITTDDVELADRIRLYRGQGMDPEQRYWFPVVGYNYRMTNIQAAIGLAQLEGIDSALEARKRVARWYDEALSELDDEIVRPAQANWAQHVFWMYTVYLRKGDAKRRDATMKRLDEMGIETRPVFYPMHVLPPYKSEEKFRTADSWSSRGINLPTHQQLTKDQIGHIAKCLKLALAQE
ncbi:MAG: DegT/DnrJ/EryC1/StrS family aminotransferase [Hyphomicrobium sp.]|uniref:DegT/DnrJ/EryC1/StrS family aminotransferase n=1 Tax=Hyphomicrobium sp. TaxID=82 RepID=UPI0039E72163